MAARIVVVDKDESMRQLFILCLRGEGWQVFGYNYADVDLFSLKKLQPDLIILAFNKQDDGLGWEFLQSVKMENATAKIPIVIRTAFRLSPDMRVFLSTQYIQVISEPFDLDPFLVLIQHTLALASQARVIFSSTDILPILVVEDTEFLRETLTVILRFEGYQVMTATDGQLALDAIYLADYCLILLDVAMPVMDGLEFLRLYDQQLRPHTPVIILSGQVDIGIQALPSFVVDVIPKPYKIEHLLQMVKTYAQPV
jgi:DNA-binding response OmpR family regulator